MPKTKSKKLTWEEKISKQLVGRKIVQVRWMTKEEADESYWDYQPVILILDEGTGQIDRVTETFILKNLLKLKITIILITHRIDYLKNFKKVKIYKIYKGIIKKSHN